MGKGKIKAMVTKFLEKFPISMLIKHRKLCKRGSESLPIWIFCLKLIWFNKGFQNLSKFALNHVWFDSYCISSLSIVSKLYLEQAVGTSMLRKQSSLPVLGVTSGHSDSFKTKFIRFRTFEVSHYTLQKLVENSVLGAR